MYGVRHADGHVESVRLNADELATMSEQEYAQIRAAAVNGEVLIGELVWKTVDAEPAR